GGGGGGGGGDRGIHRPLDLMGVCLVGEFEPRLADQCVAVSTVVDGRTVGEEPQIVHAEDKLPPSPFLRKRERDLGTQPTRYVTCDLIVARGRRVHVGEAHSEHDGDREADRRAENAPGVGWLKTQFEVGPRPAVLSIRGSAKALIDAHMGSEEEGKMEKLLGEPTIVVFESCAELTLVLLCTARERFPFVLEIEGHMLVFDLD